MAEKNNQQRPTEEQIRQRAYEIYLERGGQDGRHDDDWLLAERELTEGAAPMPNGRSVAATAGASASGAPQDAQNANRNTSGNTNADGNTNANKPREPLRAGSRDSRGNPDPPLHN